MSQVLGVIFIICYLITAMIVKINNKKIQINPIVLNLINCLFILVISAINIYIEYKNNPDKFIIKSNPLNFSNNPFENIYNNKWSWSIGLTGTIMFLLGVYCLQNIPISLLIPIQSSWLVFGLIFNHLILKNSITRDNIISVILVITGIITCSWHHFTGDSKKGELTNNKNNKNNKNNTNNYLIFFVGLAIIFSIFKALQVTLIKKVSEYVTPEQLFLMDYGTVFPLALIFFAIYMFSPFKKWQPELPSQDTIIKWFFYVAIIGFISTVFRMNAIKMIPEILYNNLSSTSIILSIIAGKLFFNEPITLIQIIGAIIIIVGILYSRLIEWVDNNHKYNTMIHHFAI
jgi:drug/metabolite transporter (DMT)-like permease